MKDAICPVCGSSRLTKKIYEDNISEELGGSLSIDKVLYKCEDCESEGDFFDDNESIISTTIQSLKSDFVMSTLNEFASHRISFSSIERSLDLPQRTLTKWKNGASSPTSAGVTLLKFIKLFPWLLEVGENKFDYATAQRIHLNVAWQKIVSHMTFNENDFVGVTALSNQISGVYFIKQPVIDIIMQEEQLLSASTSPTVSARTA